ncbi:MAG: DUF2809 domain-containing protein [Coleofasciculaceae cyanobacterium]
MSTSLIFSNRRWLTIISLLVVVPLGIFSKFYTGPLQWWFYGYGGAVLYEIFWCLFVFLLIPGKKAVKLIPLWVFIITCIIEFIQLLQTPFLQVLRASFLGKWLLGSTFVWWDFPHYFLGCLLGWFWLQQIWRLGKAKRL